MEIATFFSMYTDAVTIKKVEKKNVKEEEERKRKKLKRLFRLLNDYFTNAPRIQLLPLKQKQ